MLRPALIAAFILAFPVALATTSSDPANDETIGFPPGPMMGLGLCSSPAADILDVTIERDGNDLVVSVLLSDRDGPLSCGPTTGRWLTGGTYLEAWNENVILNIVVYSSSHYVGDPDGEWTASAVLYVGEDTGAYVFQRGPASELWQGDRWVVRLPATGSFQGVPYDVTGEVISGYADADAWTDWPYSATSGFRPQRSFDRAVIGPSTL